VRWIAGIGLMFGAISFCAVSFLADPFTAWGGAEQVRPSAARVSSNLALVSTALILLAALVVFWRHESQKSWKEALFAMTALFFGMANVARVLWIEFDVLA